MKRSYLFLLVLSACSVYKTPSKDFKEVYMAEVKMFLYQKCLYHGFKESEKINQLLLNDGNGYGEPILADRYQHLDSLAIKIAHGFELDSIQSVGHGAEGNDGKKVFSKSLKLYNSKWMDSVAKAEYSFYRKREALYYKSNP